jgi:hypothetical protein
MAKVIRVVRLPLWDEELRFDLWLPKGADIFKVDDVFAGLVDASGRVAPSDGIFLLATLGEAEVEKRRFQVAFLASGLDDLTSAAPFMPGSSFRFIANLRDGYMLFELLDPPEAPALPQRETQ